MSYVVVHRNLYAAYLPRFGLLLALLALSAGSCSKSLESRLGPSLYEVYFLQGKDEYLSTSGEPLEPQQQVLISTIMNGVYLDTHLFYNIPDKKDRTQLETSTVIVKGDFDRNSVNAPDYDGTLLIDGDQCQLDLLFPALPEGYSDLKLVGLFNRSKAQSAINILRKSSDAMGLVEGAANFEIHWVIDGLQDSIPFSLEFAQVFTASRIRSDFSPVPGA